MMINYQTHSIHVWHIYRYIYHIFWIGLPCRQINHDQGWYGKIVFATTCLPPSLSTSKLISIFEEMGAVTTDALSLLQPFPGLCFRIMQQQKGMQALLVTLAKLCFFNCLGHGSLVGQDASGGLLVRSLRWKGKPQCFQPRKTWRRWSYRGSKPDFRCSYCSVGWCMVGVYRDDITDWINL